MKIILNLYKDIDIGNNKIDSIIIATNTMTVSFLKNLISQQYGIDKSILTLTVKTNNFHFVIMTDNFPLSFYNIKNNSNIYIKIEEDTKSNEFMIKKIKEREKQSAFLRKINIFHKGLNMDTIKESTLEDFDIEDNPFDNEPHIKNNENNSFSDNNIILDDKKEINDLSKTIENSYVNAIINNNIDEFRDIMFIYKNVININKPIGKSENYSPIHYACMFGYSDMLKDLLIKYKADYNLISKDGWSPLHLCAFNGRKNILNILIHSKKLNFNLSLPNLGTALHCACKQNNLSIVSLLLYKCDPYIKNDKGELPIELTNNKYIKKLINKVTKAQNDKENENSNLSKDNMKYLSNFKFLKELENIPVCPFRYVGYCSKKGKRFSKYNQRFIEINAIKNLFLRYKFKEDYPIKTKEALFLTDIKSFKMNPTSKNDTYFYIELTVHDGTQLYRFESLKVCNLWLEKMKESIEYSKFWKKVAKKYSEVYSYLNSFKPDVFEIDYFSGEIKKFGLTVDEKEKQKIKLNELITSQKIYVDKYNNKEKIINGIDNYDLNNVQKNINLFKFEELIYENSLYEIYKVKCKLDGNNLIMKIFNTKNLLENKLLYLLTSQINNQKLIKCPFITTFNHKFQIGDRLYLTSDYQNNLSFYRNKIIFEEDSIKLYIAEIILAIEYLHNKEFEYNNLNMENILITKDNHIKLDCFQINKTNTNLEYTFDNGTTQANGKSADIYSIGSIIYELVGGMPPFYFTNKISKSKSKEEELFLFDFFSDNLKDLLSKLLCKDPSIRIGIKNKKEIKDHPWFKNINWDDLLIKNVHPPLNFSLITNEIEEILNNS